jgi:Holliday junction resolvase
MATNYEKGRNFEYRVREHFRKLGFFVARSAGSKTPVDLLAVSSIGSPLFIQCKNSTKISKNERVKFKETCKSYNCLGVIVGKDVKGKMFTLDVIDEKSAGGTWIHTSLSLAKGGIT